ncbi:MAG: putative Ig domain-containing protein [candidate division KSB1 bacterium]|nr:putative Ig domain-containing protein [candidate division KSB1 bacterium]
MSAVAALPAGGAVIAWRDERSTAALFAQRLNESWHPVWAANGIAVSNPSSKVEAYSGVLAADGSGDLILVWQSSQDDDGDIYAQRLNPRGVRLWGENGVLVYKGSREQGLPIVVSDGAGGAFIVWQDERQGGKDIYAQRLSAGGTRLWPESGVVIGQTRREQMLADAAATPDGGFVVAWSDERYNPYRVLVQRVDSAGRNLWGTGVSVANPLRHQRAPRLAVVPGSTPDFTLRVAWLEGRLLSSPNVYVQSLSANGALQWNSAVAAGRNSAEQSAIQMLANLDGSVLLVWQDGRNDLTDIYGQRVAASGTLLWGNDGLAIARVTKSQTQPRLASDGAGGLICAWLDDRSGANLAVQRITADGKAAWAVNGVLIKAGDGKTTQPAIAATATGGVLVSWTDSRKGNEDIFAQPVSAAGGAENIVPVITSTPVLAAQVGSLYTYRVSAIDFDSETAPAVRLQSAPAWLRLEDSSATLSGTPAEADTGSSLVTLLAVDQAGASARQSYSLRVNPDPDIPRIISQPDTLAREDQKYFYQIKVVGAGSDPGLRYELKTDAGWLSLSAQGELSGLPLNEHVGSYAVTITVTNSQNKSARQQFRLRVENTNDAPAIVSGPPPAAVEDSPYQFSLEARDPDAGDTLTFTAPRKPVWLQLSAAGVLTGTPRRTNLNDTLITVVVNDRAGARDQKTYVIPIRAVNHPPRITSTPPTTALEDALWQYHITASDSDAGERLSFVALERPGWLSLDASTGLLQGTPANEHVGEHRVQIQVQDRAGASDQQSFNVRVINSNDPPVFTSRPDTIALVDSLYRYPVAVQEIDAGDRATITVAAKPAWLIWESAGNLLAGVPAISDTGSVNVTLLASDQAGGTAVQQFRLKVFSLAAPDNSAPGAPQNLTVLPGQWSRATQITVRWQNPFDPSQISGAYYRFGAAPAYNSDGSFVAGPQLQELRLPITREGRVPVYVWLVDGRGNVDYRNAARAEYRHDLTPPLPARDLRLITANSSSWTNADSLIFSWQAASDLLSGVAAYEFRLNSEPILKLPGSVTRLVHRSQLNEGKQRWQITPLDSAGNRGPVVFATFGVDRTAPFITHAPIDTAESGRPLVLRATAGDGLSGVAGLRVWQRRAGAAEFVAQAMHREDSAYVTTLSGETVAPAGFEYYLEAADSAGNVALSTPVNAAAWHAVVTRSSRIPAPQATPAGYYQLVALPYRVMVPAVEAVFADDFGAYDPVRWRLFAYDPARGNVEFGHYDFRTLEPGKGYWLITAARRSFSLDESYSITTSGDFLLTLQPGWNLIASPWDFPVDWSAVQKPDGVEAQLWAFDGRQYLAAGNEMLPWQGYFVHNLTAQPQTLRIPPRRASGLNKPAAPAFPPPAGTVTWWLQLRLSDGEFHDDHNWLGVAPAAEEEWDALDWSEPPTALGNSVSLRFNRRAWRHYGGDYTADFRPPAEGVQSWPFEIAGSNPGKTLQLALSTAAFPEDWQILLTDENGEMLHQFDFATGTSLALRSSSSARRLILWVGPAQEMATAGLLTTQGFALAPGYPNPARLQGGQNAVSVIRFHLPVAAPVTLEIFDVLGRKIRTLAAGRHFAAGVQELMWDGRDQAGDEVAAGVYVYRLRTPRFTASQKVIVIK